MNVDVYEIFKASCEERASDIFIIAGLKLAVKINGNITYRTEEALMPQDTEAIIKKIFELAANDNYNKFLEDGDLDFSMSIKSVGRFRVSAYKQRSSLAAVIRIVPFGLPDPKKLGIPEAVINLYKHTKGLALVTGPTGSGKSTTLACIINEINRKRSACHIITLEDPIEFLHFHNKSIISQREITSDTASYLQALKASLRHSPDVILIGEMRDLETINIALTAAETGHFILSTLHTMSAVSAIDRIIDVFPPEQQQQVRVQLAMVLQAVVSQQIMPTAAGGSVAAFEIMTNNAAVANLIRESKLYQINSVIQSSRDAGMISMDASIVSLYKQGVITRETALAHSLNPDSIARQMG